MAANFPGAGNAVPDVYAEDQVIAEGVAAIGGAQQAVLMGEGSRNEVLVSSANGLGKDGWNTTYTSQTSDRDGRHFRTTFFPLQTNRSQVFKNGIPLVGVEQAFTPTSGSFSSVYDYRLNIDNGRIELQTASIVDQGGLFAPPSVLNTGNGSVASLTLVDIQAPTETWTVRCVSVVRDGYGQPIPGEAKFIAQGSVSGKILDGYGNMIVWKSNGAVVSNNILSFSIGEGGTSFIEGDLFTIKVKSGALTRGDSLSITYIATTDLNDPQFFTVMDQLAQKHGIPSLTNRLSLGAQIAFAHTPPGLWACQTAPAIPRRVSYSLEASASGQDQPDDLTFSLPLNVEPDFNSNINFFITDPTTETESQIIPNKVAFYDPAFTAAPNSFINSPSINYSYTVVLEDAVVGQGDDGDVTATNGGSSATLESDTIKFNSSDVGREIKILSPHTNAGTYPIYAVLDGVASINTGSFVDEGNVEFEVIDNSLQSAKILFTTDLALAAGQSLRATVVDTKDASFYDAGWTNALEALEKIEEIDIVVPLPSQTISAIQQNCRQHCEAMSQNKRERRLYIGAIRGLKPENVLGQEDAAVEDIGILEGIQGDVVSEILDGNVEDLANYSVPAAYGNTYRVMYYYPDEIVVQVGASRVFVDGFFMAAAGAGYVSALPNPVVPQTKKTLVGFTLLRDSKLSPTIIEQLAAAGICVVQPVSGGGKVVWGKTTTQSHNAEEEEDSIVAIRDIIKKAARKTMENFVGNPEDLTTQGTLQAKFDKFLKSAVGGGYISAYKDVTVARNQVEPRQWDMTAKIRPRYPINWIYIKFDVGNF